MSAFNRPGVSDDFLARAGCHHVGGDECVQLYGCRAEGIAIPFHTMTGEPIMDNGKPVSRRLISWNPVAGESQVHRHVSPRRSGALERIPLFFSDTQMRDNLPGAFPQIVKRSAFEGFCEQKDAPYLVPHILEFDLLSTRHSQNSATKKTIAQVSLAAIKLDQLPGIFTEKLTQ
jgi:hypothetical protein